MGRPEMTQDELQKLLNYDPYSGVFTWKQYRNQLALKGGIAGNIRPDGYIQIKVSELEQLYLERKKEFILQNRSS